jgi:serine/threonine-protein kinase
MLEDLFKVGTGQALTTTIPKVKISRRKVLVGALSSVLAITVIAAGLFVTRPAVDTNNLPQIPNVVGLTQVDAQALLKDYVVTIQRAHDGRIPIDRVASQIPLATTRAQKGSGVVLTISDGPGDAVIPTDLVGMSLIDARAALSASGQVIVPALIGVDAIQARTLLVQAGFLVNAIDAYDANQPIGVVIRQAPDGGTTQTIGKSVTITVNKAP